MYNANGLIQGWQCPVCGRVLSPFTSECPCYREQNTQKTTTTTAICDHNWVFDGATTGGTHYTCSKCGATKIEPFGGLI